MNSSRTVGIILAAGKGKRLNSTDTNKTALLFNGKPMIQYSVELFHSTMDQTVVVTGFAAETVKNAIPENLRRNIIFVKQEEQLGTGHAVKIALEDLKRRGIEFDLVLVGYGDHMMFYTPEVVKQLIRLHQETNAAMTLISTQYDNPEALMWGPVIRDADGRVVRVVQHKDATEHEQMMKEINAGFYCFDWSFLNQNVQKLQPSVVTGEYYITDLIDMAVSNGLRVSALCVPFETVGIGVNTSGQLEESQSLYQSLTQNP